MTEFGNSLKLAFVQRKPPMKQVLAALCLALGAQALAEPPNIIGGEVSVGLPQTISLQLTYLAMGPVIFGVGFGTFPIDPILEPLVPASAVQLSLGLPDSYTLTPTVGFGFSSLSLFVRYQPRGGASTGWVTELNLTRWQFAANITGTLDDTTTLVTTPGAINGSFSLTQPVVSAMIGYRVALSDGLGFQISTGVSYLLTNTYTSQISGSLTSVLPLAGAAAQTAFDNAKTTINNQISNEINTLRAAAKILPALNFTLGYAF